MSQAQRLAVHRDGRSSSIVVVVVVAVTKPGADHGGQGLGVKPTKRAANRGLGRDRPAPGKGIAAGTQRGSDRLGGISGPLGDRGQRPCTGQHRGGRQAQDGDQRVAAPGAGPGVADGGQVGEQIRWFGWSQRAGITKRGQTRRDRG